MTLVVCVCETNLGTDTYTRSFASIFSHLVSSLLVPFIRSCTALCLSCCHHVQSPDSDTDVKISDFGYAKKVLYPNSLRTQCGTEGYVAPEILSHKPSYDVKCDMWSLGVILFIVLGGYRPFRGSSDQVMKQIRYGEYEFHPRYWSHVSDAAKDLIRSMLTVDPDERISAADALKSAWITTDDQTLGQSDLSSNLEELKNFKPKAKLRQVVKLVSVPFCGVHHIQIIFLVSKDHSRKRLGQGGGGCANLFSCCEPLEMHGLCVCVCLDNNSISYQSPASFYVCFSPRISRSLLRISCKVSVRITVRSRTFKPHGDQTSKVKQNKETTTKRRATQRRKKLVTVAITVRLSVPNGCGPIVPLMFRDFAAVCFLHLLIVVCFPLPFHLLDALCFVAVGKTNGVSRCA